MVYKSVLFGFVVFYLFLKYIGAHISISTLLSKKKLYHCQHTLLVVYRVGSVVPKGSRFACTHQNIDRKQTVHAYCLQKVNIKGIFFFCPYSSEAEKHRLKPSCSSLHHMCDASVSGRHVQPRIYFAAFKVIVGNFRCES